MNPLEGITGRHTHRIVAMLMRCNERVEEIGDISDKYRKIKPTISVESQINREWSRRNREQDYRNKQRAINYGIRLKYIPDAREMAFREFAEKWGLSYGQRYRAPVSTQEELQERFKAQQKAMKKPRKAKVKK